MARAADAHGDRTSARPNDADVSAAGVHGLMEPAKAVPAMRFTRTIEDPDGAEIVVVLDTTWTAPGSPAAGVGPGRRISARDLAERALAGYDLLSETSAVLDHWAVASGVVELLTIRETSFWFYVRLRTLLWLETRLLWAAIVDIAIRENRPARIACDPGTDPALLDVLGLVAARHGIELDDGTPSEPETEIAPEPEPALPSAAAAADSEGPDRERTGLRYSALAGLVRRLRYRVLGPPPPQPWVVRRDKLAARVAQVRAQVDALAAEPESRLLVVREHARQLVDTASGPRSINPYLDPIVDRLRGTRLEPIVVDIRAWAGVDADWERLAAAQDPRLLLADALSAAALAEPSLTPGPGGPTGTAGASAAGEAPSADAAEQGRESAPPPIDLALAAWRDALHCPIEAFGIDLGPLVAAEVVATASGFLPGMAASIERIERFLERVRPAAILLADEYHRQDWMSAAGATGIPVVAVQHGMIHRHHSGYIHPARPAGLRLPQRTFVFGRWERDLLVEASVYRADEVSIGGSPRQDLRAPRLDDRRQFRRDLGIADDEQAVVVSGSWAAIHRQFHYPIALAALVDRPLPGVHIVVKLHPGEQDEGPYRQIIEGSARARGFAPPKVTVVQSVDLYRLLAAADAHLGIHSTVLTEAVLTRTPNLLAAGLEGADLLGYVAAGVATPVHDGAELLAALDPPGSARPDEADAAAFVAAHFEPGVASERIAADLLTWLAPTAPQDPRP